MQTRALLIAAAIGTSVAFAQQKPKAPVTVVTACEVMGGLNRYADTAVAVVGRMERSVSIIDHYEFLSQDRCQRPLVRHGHRFPNRIGILTDWEEGMPKPPEDQPELDDRLLAAKLSLVRRSTALGSHEESRFGTNRKSPLSRCPTSGLWCMDASSSCRVSTRIAALKAAAAMTWR